VVDFVGRQAELDLLDAAHRSGRSEFIPIYGRRRVGKSELILRFLKGRPGVYFLGKQAPAPLQLREFLREAASVLGEPLLATFPAEGWKAALDAVVARWKGKKKLVLAFDEFQWTAEASPELPSVLQECWDRRWRDDGRVLLILCGSYVGFMEREVLGKKSPLFGRRTAQIQLKPFGYREAALFHPSCSLVDRAKIYFLCGGIPLYLRCFSPDRSVEMNITANLLREFAPLFREPDFLLREELRELESYYAVLLALAAGATTSRAMAQVTGIGDRSLQYYLKQLMELGYLARRYPVTGHAPIARHVRYDLEDPLLRFWFRFIYPNTSFILQMGPERALADRIRPELDAYFGRCFERLCREALPALYAREGVSARIEVGEYWDKATQIDVVGWRGDGWTDLGECKWGPVRSRKALEEELDAKVVRYPNDRGASIGRRFFTRDRVPDAIRGGRGAAWHCLEDLYESPGERPRKRRR
jgi:AAA+ ATPase superfamily predicted ATPase